MKRSTDIQLYVQVVLVPRINNASIEDLYTKRPFPDNLLRGGYILKPTT